MSNENKFVASGLEENTLIKPKKTMHSPTPGPWKLSPFSKSNEIGFVIESKESEVIAWTFTCSKNSLNSMVQSSLPTKQNAQLMVAAPCMFEALEDLLAIIKVDQLIPESVSYMKQARLAIKKAKGE